MDRAPNLTPPPDGLVLPSPLLVITDRHQARHSLEVIAQAVGEAGGRWLLLRDRDLEPVERRRLACRIKAVAGRHRIHLSLSSDVDLAAQLGTSVHLQSAAAVAAARRRLGRAALIGVSAHAPADVQAAGAAGADYVTLSPIFPTASKPGYGPALGTGAITQAARLGIAVVALGGVGAAAARRCLEAGAAAVAVMGDIMRAPDPGASTAAVLAALGPPAPPASEGLRI